MADGTVFVVEVGDYDDRYIAGVFSTREKAQAWIDGQTTLGLRGVAIHEERLDNPTS